MVCTPGANCHFKKMIKRVTKFRHTTGLTAQFEILSESEIFHNKHLTHFSLFNQNVTITYIINSIKSHVRFFKNKNLRKFDV